MNSSVRQSDAPRPAAACLAAFFKAASRAGFAALAAIVLSSLLPAGAAAAAEPNTLSAEEVAQGWILLFDGQTTFGWQAASQANWEAADGVLRVGQGEPGLLVTTSEFGDFELLVDFKAGPTTNSGVFLRTPERPTNPAADCYELNIATATTSPFMTGSFVGRQKAETACDLATWHTFRVSAEGGRFVVKLDGQTVLDYRDPQPLGRGRIGLQLNQGPVEFRNVKLRPLGLDDWFNGRDLEGWSVFPGQRSEFGVSPEGTLAIKNGRGQLESQRQLGDFVLQLDVRTNGRGLNSGVFFRNVPGQMWQGYESQIHNAYRDGDRADPVDYGTGGFYRRQKARRVVADDHAWATMTLVVAGAHMAAWVNGYQVSDWTDLRAPHENPREGLRLAAGTIALQGHDPTTNLEFRGIRAAELPARSPAGAAPPATPEAQR